MKNPVNKLFAVAVLVGAGTASADVPRTLASGAPACGNTIGKGPDMTAQVTARRGVEAQLDAAQQALSTLIADERAAGTFDARVYRMVEASAQIAIARVQLVVASVAWAQPAACPAAVLSVLEQP